MPDDSLICFALGTFPCSYIPTEDVQHLRELIHLRHAIIEEKTRSKNRIHAMIDKHHNITLPSKDPSTEEWQHSLQQYINSHPHTLELQHAYDHYQYLEKKTSEATHSLDTRKHSGIQNTLLLQPSRVLDPSLPATSLPIFIPSPDSKTNENSAGMQASSPSANNLEKKKQRTHSKKQQSKTPSMGTHPSSQQYRKNQYAITEILREEKTTERQRQHCQSRCRFQSN